MTRTKTTFVCQSCGAEFPKWQGKCFECGSWNSLVETVVSTRNAKLKIKNEKLRGNEPARLDKVGTREMNRFSSGFFEFDRVLGGGPPTLRVRASESRTESAGMVPGSVILLAGEPGIGKSTLLLQVATSTTALYVSGEESVEHLKLRADRLGLDSSKILALTETVVDVISEATSQLVSPEKLRNGASSHPPLADEKLRSWEAVKLMIIDSIQALRTDDLTSAAGSISQVQECARRLARIAKNLNLPLILVGHVTKEGAIAGPKTLEHLVDVVLYLEGERFSNFRILRGVKNRFGQTSEVGIFKMTDKGMVEVKNPSAEMLSTRKSEVPGSVITVTIEGQRPLLLEIQALTSGTPFGLPRRTVNGIDYNRLLMLLAVLQRRAGFSFANQDVYVNVSGGFKCFEPAVDLAVCLSLVSSLKNKTLPKDLVALGEVGLLGEIKKPSRFEERIKEAKNLGFTEVIAYNQVDSIREAVEKAISN